MADDLVTAIEARTDLPKDADETLKEYIERVGEATSTDQEVVASAVDYVVRYQYGRSAPSDDEPLRRFLAALEDEPDGDADGDTAAATVKASQPATAPATDGTSPGETAVSDPSPAPAAGGDDAAVAIGPSDVELPPSLHPIRSQRRRDQHGFKGGIRGREARKLLAWFVLMLATAPVIGWLLGRTWIPGHALYDAGGAALANVLGLAPIPALELAGAFGLGLFGAILTLFIADVKKRVQGMLLLIGGVLAVGVLAGMGVLLPNIDFASPINLGGLAVGFLLGLAIEAPEIRAIDWAESTFRRPTTRSGDVVEFRLAAYTLFGLVAVLLAVTLAQAILAEVVAVYDLAASALFLVMAYRFVQYESELSYVTLGPARAGKSMLALGLCLELLAADGPHPKPNAYLQNGIERVSNLQPGNERWPLPSTAPDELEVSSLEVIVGYYFPRRLELTALDYAGQHLPRVVEHITDGRGLAGEDDGVAAEVAGWIRESDTVVVLLDIERLVHPERFQEDGPSAAENISWGLEYYASILEAHDPDDTVVVATKCDILIHQDLVDPPTAHADWAAFREAVTGYLADRPDVQEMLDLAEESTIHPVFYATERRDDEYVPRLDEAGNLMPVGFGHLIETFSSRQ